MNGDIKAVNTILRISEQRSRLLGLDKPDVAHSGSGSLVDPAYWDALKETHGTDIELNPAAMGAAGRWPCRGCRGCFGNS